MRNLLLTALLVACASASAADQAQPYVKKFDAPTPDLMPGKRAEVSMPIVPRQLPAPKPAAPAGTNTPTAPSGMPMIPASDPTNNAVAPSPAISPPAAANPAAPTPGQPVTTYATMAQAAQAGVDPLNEHKGASAVQTTAAPVTPAPVAQSGFDLKNPGSWLPWVQSHREQAMKTALLALGILVVGFGAIRFRARRNTQE